MAVKSSSTSLQSLVTPENRNLMAALSYLLGFISGIFFLLVEKNDDYVRFHAAQSTVLSLLVFVISFVPVVGWILSTVLAPLFIILAIFLMWKAYTGEKFRLPLIAEWADKLLAQWPK